MTPDDKKVLALFFTCGVSLQTWDKVGNLSREIKPYNELAPHFKQIFFFTYGNAGDLAFKDRLAANITIVPKRWNLPDPLYMLLLPIAARKELKEADILKTNQMEAGLAAYLAKKLYKKRLVVRCGFEWLSFAEMKKKPDYMLWVIKMIERLLYRSADHIILSAQNLKEFVISRFGIPETKITIIHNYVDTDLFRPLEVERHDKTIAFVGRLNQQKNLFNLITAVSGLDVKLVVYGSGELEQELKTRAENEKADVEFRGNVANDKLPEELNKCGAFILPSLYEGNPKVLLEASACGLPVIATDVVGNRELIKHKENGYLCQTDAASIREAIREVMNDIALRETMGRNARATILKDFALPVVLAKELTVYKEL